MDMNVSVRALHIEDVECVRALWKPYAYEKLKVTENFEKGVIVHDPEQPCTFDSMITNSDYAVFVVVVNKTVVGYIKYIIDPNYICTFLHRIEWTNSDKKCKKYLIENIKEIAYLDQIVVSNELEYHRKGIGKKLEKESYGMVAQSIFIGKILSMNKRSLQLHKEHMKVRIIGQQKETLSDGTKLIWNVVLRNKLQNTL